MNDTYVLIFSAVGSVAHAVRTLSHTIGSDTYPSGNLLSGKIVLLDVHPLSAKVTR